MKKQTIIIGLLLMLVVFTTSFSIAQEQKTRINEYCNFEYMESCLLEIPRWEKRKLYNIVEEDTLFDFYFLGMKDGKPMGLIIDGDTDEVKFFNILEEYGELILLPKQKTGITISTILYNDVDEVLYIEFEKEIHNVNPKK